MSTKKLAKFVMSRLGLPSSDETETATPASSLKKRLDDSNLSSSVGLGPVIDHKDGDADGGKARPFGTRPSKGTRA